MDWKDVHAPRAYSSEPQFNGRLEDAKVAEPLPIANAVSHPRAQDDADPDRFIYLDYQATTPVDKAVMDEMLPYFHETFAKRRHARGALCRLAVFGGQSGLCHLIGP